jgi:hypothetical protein
MTCDGESRDSNRRKGDFMLAYCDAQRKPVFLMALITGIDVRRALRRKL